MTGLDRKNTNLYAAIENGLISADAIRRISENAKRQKKLKEKLARLPDLGNVDRTALKAVFLSDLSKSIETPAAQKELMQHYIQSVTI